MGNTGDIIADTTYRNVDQPTQSTHGPDQDIVITYGDGECFDLVDTLFDAPMLFVFAHRTNDTINFFVLQL